MKPGSILRLYPRAWRERYGDEVLALFEQTGGGWRCAASLVFGAADEWLQATSRLDWVDTTVAALAVAMAELMLAASILLLLLVLVSSAELLGQRIPYSFLQESRLPSVSLLVPALADAWANAVLLVGYGAVVSLPMSIAARGSFGGSARAASVLVGFVLMTLVVRAVGGSWEIAVAGCFFLWRMAYRADLPVRFDQQRATL